MREVPHRSQGRHLGYAIMGEERQQPVHHLQPKAGKAVRKIIDGRGHDGAHLWRLEWGPYAHGMAHHDISRQLRLFGLAHHHVAQRAHAGIHAVSANALPNEGFYQRARRADSLLRVVRQRERRAFGYIAYLPPGKGTIEKYALRHVTGLCLEWMMRFDWAA